MHYEHDKVPDMATLCPIAFASKCQSITEWHYSNIEPRDLCHLEKFHHYCFTNEVSIITDNKPLVAIISKDWTTMSQHLQQIMLYIHQYRVYIICKPGLELT